MTNYEREFHTNTDEYHHHFWNAVRGKQFDDKKINKGKNLHEGTYYLPFGADSKYAAAVKSKSLFRNLATVMKAYNSGCRINTKYNDDLAAWVPEGEAIPAYDGTLDFTTIPLDWYKLVTVLKMDCDFLHDASFNTEAYLVDRLAKNFARAEDNAFINGTGENMPTGILHDTEGANVGAISADISYDDVIALYFSVKPEYRSNGTWLMRDETALKLRTLKYNAGNYLWRDSDDTILGKKVLISEFMPNMSDSNKPITFGDFSYYWVVERRAVSVRVLKEYFAALGQVGYLALEFMDAKLIHQEAVKVLQMKTEN